MLYITPEILLTLAIIVLVTGLYAYARGQHWNAAITLVIALMVWIVVVMRSSHIPLIADPIVRVAIFTQGLISLLIILIRVPPARLSQQIRDRGWGIAVALPGLGCMAICWWLYQPLVPVFEMQWLLWLSLAFYFLWQPRADLGLALVMLSWSGINYLLFSGAGNAGDASLDSTALFVFWLGIALLACLGLSMDAIRQRGIQRLPALLFLVSLIIIQVVSFLEFDWTLPS